MKKLTCIKGGLAAAGLLVSVASLSADVLLDVNNWAGYSDGNLVGQGSWAEANGGDGSRTDPVVVTSSSGSKSVVLNAEHMSQDVGLDTENSLGAGGQVFFAIEFSVDSFSATDYFLSFTEGDSFSLHVGQLFLTHSAGEGDYALGITTTTESSVDINSAANELLFGQTYIAVVGYDFNTGTTSLWINPTADDFGMPNAISSDLEAGKELSRLLLRNGASSKNSVNLFNLVVTTDFTEALTAVPEPSTYAFFSAVGLIGLVALRRRRK